VKAVFIETSGFTAWLSESVPDDVYAGLQRELMDNPEKGTVMPGCGGLRKVRVPSPRRGKGKRGGERVIYLYVPEAKWFFMIDGYGKGEQDDLTAAQKRQLSRLADQLKHEARKVARQRNRDTDR
jgi:hypothetical protein